SSSAIACDAPVARGGHPGVGNTSVTLVIGDAAPYARALVEVVRGARDAGIAAAVPGGGPGDIGAATVRYVGDPAASSRHTVAMASAAPCTWTSRMSDLRSPERHVGPLSRCPRLIN